MITIPKGTKDVLPSESYRWQYVERTAREIAARYGLKEIRTPTFEHTELFLRGVGETTDVVNKEMYTFLDKGERSMTLKPEGTAGVARAYVENGLGNGVLPAKMFYLTPVFRYEKPQAGRLREHHQFGIELYGSAEASMDAEAISVAHAMLCRVGVTGLELSINSIGCPECRAEYNRALRAYFGDRIERMCETCRERLDKNPLRILDCKNPECREFAANAPEILDYLCDDCRAHFEALKQCLRDEGIAYRVDPRIVRGLDYYTRTVFEFVTTAIGAQGTVCGGGRYDGLVAGIGGKPTPAVGFGMGLERLLLVLDACGAPIPEEETLDVYVANVTSASGSCAARVTKTLRDAGLSADCDRMARSLKAQFKYADRIRAKFVVTIGEEEEASGNATVKDMRRSSQETVSLKDLAAYVAARVE